MIDYRCSVVMTTYNGAKYITQQMDSLRNQTRHFDEVIIMDDCSTDGTVSIVKKYIFDNHLDTWKVIQNETNNGWKKNFKLGFDLATGDLIFPCDQDDIWHHDKCEKMLKKMMLNPNIDLLVSNYTLFVTGVDKGSSSYKESEKHMKNDGSINVLPLDARWPYITRPGCTYCFRKTFYDDIKQHWDVRFPHDALLWRYARIKKSMALLNESLIDFRRHGDNATTVKVRTKEERIQTFDDYIYFHKIALSYPLNEYENKVILNGIRFLEKRKKLYLSRNILRAFELLLLYYKYYLNIKGVAGDIFFVFRTKQHKK